MFMTPRSLFRGVALLALVVGVASCSGVPSVGPTTLKRYTPGYAGLFAAAGQLELIGDAGSPEATAQLAAMAAEAIPRGSMAGARFSLTPRGQDQRQAKNRVVVVIGGAGGESLCSNPPRQGNTFRGQYLSVGAAACNGDDALSWTSGSIGELQGTDDPRISRLFSQIGSELFPIRNPNYEDRDRDGFDF